VPKGSLLMDILFCPFLNKEMKTIFALLLFGNLSLASSTPPDPYQYFDNNGVRIAFRSFGSGDPLFVLNGGPGRSSDTFTDLAQTLSLNGHRIIIFDQRGTGRSKLNVLNENTVSLDLMVSDLEALRLHLKYGSISILGHSFGGMFAMAYASRYPQNIKSLILSASGGIDLSWQGYVTHNMLSRLNKKARKRYEFWISPEQEKKDPIGSALNALRILVPAYIYHQNFVPKLMHDLVNLNYYTPAVNELVWKSMEHYNMKGVFKSFQPPVLIIDGRQDILGEAVPMAIRDEFPTSRLEFLDECSHYPWLDSPDKYFTLIQEFLNK
jgi:proline iminopeptidase